MIRLHTNDGLEFDNETSSKEVKERLEKIAFYSHLIGYETDNLSQKIIDDIVDEIYSLIDECKKLSTKNIKHTPRGFNFSLHANGNIILWD